MEVLTSKQSVARKLTELLMTLTKMKRGVHLKTITFVKRLLTYDWGGVDVISLQFEQSVWVEVLVSLPTFFSDYSSSHEYESFHFKTIFVIGIQFAYFLLNDYSVDEKEYFHFKAVSVIKIPMIL